LTVLVILSALVFVPIKYVYPTRTAMHKQLTMTLATLWGVINVLILVRYPQRDPILLWASLLFVVYYCGLSFYRMWLDGKQAT
jgi:phosphatidylcholine synthase